MNPCTDGGVDVHPDMVRCGWRADNVNRRAEGQKELWSPILEQIETDGW